MDVGQTSPLSGKILGISQSGDEFIESEVMQQHLYIWSGFLKHSERWQQYLHGGNPVADV